ncbi:mitochondrial dynamics protein MID51-like [Antedon mediterranea]|uniref:mitochondrial dynamics protein MID51-like n=1 Tax=Antedon mediterranea TaxID=105859 RepID=UPI003AF60F8D
MVLSVELKEYYNEHATFSDHENVKANQIVERIENFIKHFLEHTKLEELPYTFGNLLHQGSSYEGLKVIKPDEFDLMLPLKLNEPDWEITKPYGPYETPGYFFIKKKRIYLNPKEIKQTFQSILQKVINRIQQRNTITLRASSGPALTLNVCYDDNLKMSIDIVPAISLNGMLAHGMKHTSTIVLGICC